jgi:uroporphyrinogen decarboxylase
MAIEPSALGARICFWPDRTPDIVPTLHRIEDAGRLAPVNPWSDGLMALALRRYQTGKQRIFEAGYTIPFATARGPLTVASFLRGLTAFMLDLTEQPEAAHALLNLTTNAIVAWLKAQQEAIGDCVEGIFVLDDIPGMLSRRLYLEFAHPYLKRICDAFPGDWVKLYHNDANIKPFVEDLTAVGFDALNWSHKFSVADIRQRTAGKLCLMGNVPPLEVGVKGTPGQVREAALQALSASGNQNFILSLGGGVSPGMPESNIRALVDACGA